MPSSSVALGPSTLLVDGLNLFMRSYAAFPAMTSNGQQAGGIVGFISSLEKIMRETLPTQVIVVWESGGSSRKRQIFPDYKMHRRPAKLNRFYEDDIPDTVENRNWQLVTLTQVLKHLPVCQVYVPDCEADDVIGYVSRYRVGERVGLTIASSDRDFYQLLSDRVQIFSIGSKRLVTHQTLLSDMSISAQNFCLAKCVVGDDSDNIPGVKGAGFKTLSKRLPKFGRTEDYTIDDLLSDAQDQGGKVKVMAEIALAGDLIRRNWRLCYLDIANISGTQIEKINGILDSYEPVRNKLGAKRILAAEGLPTLGIDSLFFSLNFASGAR
jgi:5'-3' exonuclease